MFDFKAFKLLCPLATSDAPLAIANLGVCEIDKLSQNLDNDNEKTFAECFHAGVGFIFYAVVSSPR